jgi:hypothetical protein
MVFLLVIIRKGKPQDVRCSKICKKHAYTKPTEAQALVLCITKEIIILKSTIVTDGGSLNMASTLTECVYVRTMKVIGRYQFNTYQFLSIAMPLFV